LRDENKKKLKKVIAFRGLSLKLVDKTNFFAKAQSIELKKYCKYVQKAK
jgi:hypothetical protein